MSSTDMLGLTGKVGIVWGGGFGMGERSSLRLAEAGAKVAVIDLIPERAEKIAAQINNNGGLAQGIFLNPNGNISISLNGAPCHAASPPRLFRRSLGGYAADTAAGTAEAPCCYQQNP